MPAGERRVVGRAAAGDDARRPPRARARGSCSTFSNWRRWTIAPVSVASSAGQPGAQRVHPLARAARRTRRAATRWTSRREVEPHDWPCQVKFMPRSAPSIAALEVGVGEDDDRVLAAELERHGLDDVRRRRAAGSPADLGRAGEGDPAHRRGASTSASPASSPSPVTTLTTPGGNTSRRARRGAAPRSRCARRA